MNIVRIGKYLAGEVYDRGFREEAEFEQIFNCLSKIYKDHLYRWNRQA